MKSAINYDSDHRIYVLNENNLVLTSVTFYNRFKTAKELANITHPRFHNGLRDNKGYRGDYLYLRLYRKELPLVLETENPSGIVKLAEFSEIEKRTYLEINTLNNIGIDPTFLYEFGRQFGTEIVPTSLTQTPKRRLVLL